MCLFGNTVSDEYGRTNSFLARINNTVLTNYTDVIRLFHTPYADGNTPFPSDEVETIFNFVNATIYTQNENFLNPALGRNYSYGVAGTDHFTVRTCNSFWNPQVTVSQTNVDPFYLGMASQATEREDTIITPDLRGKVFGPFDFNRRDLMAVNMQRARDHGLPDFNSARLAYGLPRLNSFEELNPLYGIDALVTEGIENLRDVYNNDIDRCDIWACGLAETIPSDTENDALRAISGPGELFSEVLFDQFMRIRHADRFWYENYNLNG